ncbi:synaptobrevin-domain-containing protein [Sistotremastrum suecicum HHB10207 ss-3]|uniref:Synaptobrevin homolog YKT6 n=1 Tax=Sistotremastrum suecicum HHB10207 ss-3 TaxID=1314776 RepID=A0A165YR16_9AGAM|nr:synaptobrevin-domain-containing protein [Sistotremastrum suecicum HHB10207 ss-3]
MSLIHALVANAESSTILVESSTGKRDFSQAVQTILSKIPPNNSKLTYVWEQYLFHYVAESGVVYLVMADDSVGRRLPFTFLTRLQALLPPSTALSTESSHHGLQLTYGDKLEKLMKEFNENPNEAGKDALTNAQNELNQVKDIMVHNVEQILSRGERIDLLVDKTDNMATQAVAFRRGARAQRRRQFWRNQKILWLSGGVGILIIYLIIAGFCGAGLNQCGKKNDSSS